MSIVPIGSWEMIDDGDEAAILAVGTMVEAAVTVRRLLMEKGIRVGVVNCRFVKPMDLDLLVRLAAKHRLLVTLEENTIRGGFGTGVYETLNEAGAPLPRMLHLGIPDRFIEHGSREALFEDIGLLPAQIASTIARALSSARSITAGA